MESLKNIRNWSCVPFPMEFENSILPVVVMGSSSEPMHKLLPNVPRSTNANELLGFSISFETGISS